MPVSGYHLLSSPCAQADDQLPSHDFCIRQYLATPDAAGQHALQFRNPNSVAVPQGGTGTHPAHAAIAVPRAPPLRRRRRPPPPPPKPAPKIRRKVPRRPTLLPLTRIPPSIPALTVAALPPRGATPAGTTIIPAHHALGRGVRALLLDVRGGHDLGGEVQPFAQVVEALGR